MLLEGLQLPLTTPFYSDGRLNLSKLEYNVRRYSKTPVAGFVVLSENGEATMLSDEETRQTLESVANAAASEKALLAGVARDSLAGTMDMAEFAAKAGYDAVLIKRPSPFQENSDHRAVKAMTTYFQAVADRSALPVVLYSTGPEAGEALPVEIVIALAEHPRIIGLVDVFCRKGRFEKILSGTTHVEDEVTVTTVFAAVTERMRRQCEAAADELIAASALTGGAILTVAPTKGISKTRTKKVGFQLLGASTRDMLDALHAGAVGAMPSFAAAAPQATYEVLAAWKDGDQGLAEEKQARLERIAERVEEELGVAGIKFGCDLNGYFGGSPRSPQLPLTAAEREEIDALMHGLRN
ncbi:MAG TPA: dihydrodipicolinate synthase family protein [Edaphobacter sp.]|jgi:4-hydroxy-2-oxoglutarate aldolase|nr:dihydrodipicolinate synthase family protein [Edaphobacter sp.]